MMSVNPTMVVDEVTMPAAWASALVNGDYSGLEECEAERCERAVERLAREGWRVVDVKRDEEGNGDGGRFTWSYGLYDPEGPFSGGEVIDYVVVMVA